MVGSWYHDDIINASEAGELVALVAVAAAGALGD
jgi:hypothetical protein